MTTTTSTSRTTVALVTLCLAGCAATGLPSFGGDVGPAVPEEASGRSEAAVGAVVIGESGIAAGIPAAVQAFPELGRAAPVADRMPTLLPRQLPTEDAGGDAFADRVSIAPDGRRLVIGTQQGDKVEVQVVGVNRKDLERRELVRGQLDFVGWADPRTALIGTRRVGSLRVEAMDIATGDRRALSERSGPGGVLTLTRDGRAVTTRAGREAFACADGEALPVAYEGRDVVQAGPLDRRGRIVFRTVEGDGVLIPYDCDAGAFAAPIYEGPAFDGALYDTAGGGYIGVWDEDGPRYLDPSLAYEMEDVAASFPGEVAVWPIEFTRSPNTLLLYVSGPDVAPSYYVLDRYAGALDLHVSYERQE